MAWKVRRQRDPGAAAAVSEPTSPFQIQGKVGRVEEPAPQAFQKGYVQANRPVVVKGEMAGWRARSGWSWDALSALLGEHAGEVIVSANGLYPDYLSQPSPMTKVAMTFKELVERMFPEAGREAGRAARPPILAPGETYYIYGKSYLFEAFPELLK